VAVFALGSSQQLEPKHRNRDVARRNGVSIPKILLTAKPASLSVHRDRKENNAVFTAKKHSGVRKGTGIIDVRLRIEKLMPICEKHS